MQIRAHNNKKHYTQRKKKQTLERVCWAREMEKNNQREEIGNECELEPEKT